MYHLFMSSWTHVPIMTKHTPLTIVQSILCYPTSVKSYERSIAICIIHDPGVT